MQFEPSWKRLVGQDWTHFLLTWSYKEYVPEQVEPQDPIVGVLKKRSFKQDVQSVGDPVQV